MSQYKLKMAAAEIRDICVKHDIAASIMLADPDNGERLQVLDTTWSCARLEGDMIRLKTTTADFPTKESKKRAIESTAGIAFIFLEMWQEQQMMFTTIIATLSERFNLRNWIKNIDRKETRK